MERDHAKARLKWETLAKQKDWTQVKADLSVYRYSGEDITEDPSATDKYRDQVVDELGFGEDWKTRRSDLTEADVAAAREVLHRKAGAFLAGTLAKDDGTFRAARYRTDGAACAVASPQFAGRGSGMGRRETRGGS